jgi:aldehyde dehydrogenase (NAD+)
VGGVIEWSEAQQHQPSVRQSAQPFPKLVLANSVHRTEQEIVSVSSATAQDVDKAVLAARSAFETWRKTPGTARGRLLMKLADLVEIELEFLATIEALDNGKPYTQALGDIQEVCDVFRYYGGWADKSYGQTVETTPNKFTYTLREPIGVCGQIVP